MLSAGEQAVWAAMFAARFEGLDGQPPNQLDVVGAIEKATDAVLKLRTTYDNYGEEGCAVLSDEAKAMLSSVLGRLPLQQKGARQP